jgi:hypothetical protein
MSFSKLSSGDMDIYDIDFTDPQFQIEFIKQWVEENPEIFEVDEDVKHTRKGSFLRLPGLHHWLNCLRLCHHHLHFPLIGFLQDPI